MDAKAAFEIVREVGVKRLGGPDGCLCMRCAVQGVNIDVSCRKSGSSLFVPGYPDFHGVVIRVYSRHLNPDFVGLQMVADEVAAQLAGDASVIATRLCEYRMDAEKLCLYCEGPRTDLEGYYCDDCEKLTYRAAYLI